MAQYGGYVSARAMMLGASLLIWASPALAQIAGEDAGGLLLGLSLSEQLRHDNDGTALRTDLGFSLLTQTRSQNLVLDLASGFELGGGAVDPRFGLDYGLENRFTALAFSANFRRSDLDTLTLTDTLDGTALVLDPGQREDIATTLDLEFGRETPFGTTVTLSHAETRYLDTLSTTLIDSTTQGGAVDLRFDMSKTVTAYARLSVNDLDRATGNDVRRTSLGASLDLEISEDINATVDLGGTRIEQDDGTTASTSEGVYYGASLVAARPNGSLSLLLDSDISETGRRSTLQVNRQFELRRGALNLGTGLSRNSGAGKTDPLYSLAFVQDLPRARLSADFSQRFSTTSAGIGTLESRLSFGVLQELGPLARLRTALALRDSNQLIATGVDSQQLDISLDYAHQITPDWDLFGGISHSLRRTDGQARQTKDTVFFGLRREFEWRP